MILPRSFYERETVTVARELLGKYLVHETAGDMLVGKIVETEAYLGTKDPAAHSYRGPTARTQVMFGKPGYWYIYFIYGVHYCINVVTQPPGQGEAVLIRALEPMLGREKMRTNRARLGVPPKDIHLCNGPAKLVQALGIVSSQNGEEATVPPLYVADTIRPDLPPITVSDQDVQVTPRVGITQAVDWPLRFVLKDSPFISRP